MAIDQQNKGLNKIAFIVGQLGSGGLERQLYYLVDQLQKSGKEVYCFVWNNQPEQFYANDFKALMNERLILLEADSINGKFRDFKKGLKSFKPDLIISFSTFTNPIAWLMSYLVRCKAIGAVRTSGNRLLQKKAFKTFVNLLFPPKLLVNSQSAIRELKTNFVIRKACKFALLDNHLDLDKIRKNLKDQEENVTSISVGRFYKPKRIDRLIEYGKRLRDKGVDFIHWHIGDGPQKAEIEELIRYYNLEQHIKLLGEKRDIFPYLSQAKFFVLTSEYEGTPNAVMEAMAVGLPVITTNCGDIERYIEHGVNGYVLDEWDPETFANFYEQYLKDESLRYKHGQNNLEQIQLSDVSRYATNFSKALEKLNVR